MSTKYHRTVERAPVPERRRTPWMRQGPPMQRMSRRMGLFVIFAFLLSAVLISQLAIRRTRLDPFSSQPVVRGEATITETRRTPDGQTVIDLEIALEDSKALKAEWPIPESYWSSLKPGERVALIYQVSATGTDLRVVECGLVALPGGIR